MLGDQYPNNVDPAYEYAEDSNDQAYYQPERAPFFKESGPPYDNFRNPVYYRDKQQDHLNQAALPIKPRHGIIPPYKDLHTLILTSYVLNNIILPFKQQVKK